MSQSDEEVLTHEMANIRKEMESVQKRREELLHRKDALERNLRLREAEIEVLKLKNSSIAIVKEQEIDNYHKQLKSLRQELEAERKKVSPLQEEFQKKEEEMEEKKMVIKHLTEARDEANSELEREREKAEQKSKELTLAAAPHAVRYIYHRFWNCCCIVALITLLWFILAVFFVYGNFFGLFQGE